jgi:hypothetical protein
MIRMDDDSVEDYIYEAREELKRVEHIIFVSLKYTRTTDVIRNAVLRLVSFFDMISEAYMIDSMDKELIDKVPRSPPLRMSKIAELYPDDKELQQYIKFYFFLKGVLKQEYEKINEYRRHVGMKFDFGTSSTIINIDSLETCKYFSFDFYNFSNKFFGLAKEED